MNDEIHKSTPTQIAERRALAASTTLCGGSFQSPPGAFSKITRLIGEPLTRIAADENVWLDRSGQSFGPAHLEMARQAFSKKISKLG